MFVNGGRGQVLEGKEGKGKFGGKGMGKGKGKFEGRARASLWKGAGLISYKPIKALLPCSKSQLLARFAKHLQDEELPLSSQASEALLTY